jgi:hypothetical protein
LVSSALSLENLSPAFSARAHLSQSTKLSMHSARLVESLQLAGFKPEIEASGGGKIAFVLHVCDPTCEDARSRQVTTKENCAGDSAHEKRPWRAVPSACHDL